MDVRFRRVAVLLVLALAGLWSVACGGTLPADQPTIEPATSTQAVSEPTERPTEQPAAQVSANEAGEPEGAGSTGSAAPPEGVGANGDEVKTGPAGDGVVRGWAALAEKDDYGDVEMTDLPVGYIGAIQMRQVLEEAGWESGHIHELHEFNRDSLQQDLDWLAENADEDDVVVLYVAAHGRYLSDVLLWDEFFAADWQQIASHRRLLVIDACQAANFTGAISDDQAPYVSIAAVAGDEYGWSGLEEEGLPIIGGVFTHYFAAAFGDPGADGDGDGFVSAQEAALRAEDQQRAYMHDVVFAVPEFKEMYHGIGAHPDQDPTFPDVVIDDTLGEPLFLALEAYR